MLPATLRRGKNVSLASSIYDTQGAGTQKSSGLSFVQLSDGPGKPRTVSLQLHWTYSADVLQRAEGPGTPDRQLRESTIREYNIRRHLFLARDVGANRLESSEGAFFRWSESKVLIGLNLMRSCPD